MKEELPAYLVSSNQGYFIYLFETYVLESTDKGDLIHPANDSSISQMINMLITRSDGMNPLPENVYDNVNSTEYMRIERGNQIFDITISYPTEALGGGSNMLYSMIDTIVVQ